MTTEKLYDLEYLIELDDNECLIEIIELFFETTPEMLAEVDENVRKRNWDSVLKASHKLKSSLGPLQLSKMVAIASALEENSKLKINLDNMNYLNKELQNQYALVKPMIEAELRKAKNSTQFS